MTKKGNTPTGETLQEKQARLKKSALINAEIFYHYELIARATGITDDTLKKYRDTDHEFSEELEKVRTQFIGRNMRRSKPEFLLERLEPKFFKERKETELTGNLGVLSAEQAEQLIRARAERSDS
jgi:hypothetical protein